MKTGSSSTAARSPTRPSAKRARPFAARIGSGRTPKFWLPDAPRNSIRRAFASHAGRCLRESLGIRPVKLNSFARNDATSLAPAELLAQRQELRRRSRTGCDHRCTFCSIWQARGPARSLPDSKQSGMPSRARSIAAPRRLFSPAVDITDYAGGCLEILCQRLLAAQSRG